MNAAGNRVLHDPHQLNNAGLYLFRIAQGFFVLQHQIGNRQIVTFTQFDHFSAAVKLKRHFVRLASDSSGHFVPAGNGAAADGKINLFQQKLSLVVKGAELHAVGMFGQKGLFVENDVFLHVERNCLFSAERQFSVFFHPADVIGLRIHLFRLQSEQAVNHRVQGTVAAAGQRQRTVKFGFDRCRLRQKTLLPQISDIAAGGFHRPHRMRTGRPYSDGKNFKKTVVHNPLRLLWSQIRIRRILTANFENATKKKIYFFPVTKSLLFCRFLL